MNEWLHNNNEVVKAIEFIVDKTLTLPLNINGDKLTPERRVELYNPLADKTLNEMMKNYHFGLFYDGEVYFLKKGTSFYIARKTEVVIEKGLLKYGNITTDEFYKITNVNPATRRVEPRYKLIQNELQEKYYSQENNIKLLKNGLVIREIMVFKRSLQAPGMEQVKRKLKNNYKLMKERMFGIEDDRESTTIVLDNNEIDYKVVDANLADIQNTQLANENRDTIYNFLGVPPQLMGSKTTATYSNYKEAHDNFLLNTIIPNAEKMAALITKYYFNDEIVVTVDTEEIKRRVNGANRFNELWMMREEGMITDEQFMDNTGYSHLKGGE